MPRLARLARADLRPPLTPAQQRVVSLSQWITPPWLAEVVVDVAEIKPGHVVLEPSAGTGNIVRAALARGASVDAVDVDPGMVRRLRAIDVSAYPASFGLRVHRADFLTWQPPACAEPADVCPTNVPYENGADLAHMLRALSLAPRVVGILRLNAIVGGRRTDALWSRFDVRQVLVCAERPDFGEEMRRVSRGQRAGNPTGSAGAESDFAIVDVFSRPRRPGTRPSFDWIRRPG